MFVNYRADRAAAETCVAAIARAGGTAESLQADVADVTSVRRMVRRVERSAGRLDVLVANAGIAPVAQDLQRVTPSVWRRTLDTNAMGPFLCVQAAAPLMSRAGGGRIVFVGSVASRLGGNIGPHYAASKAALRGLIAWLGRALGPDRITVNLVEPGFVETDLSASFYRTAASRRRLRMDVPLGRLGTTDEIAALVAFLAGPDAGYVTGEAIAVAGGR